ncbi:type II secretion system F family protein [Aquisalibacillus elongatus]|uniref:Tight adherence protein C n=1 Tax=Aquisalibacillus elongatus TaxID=485577 RepID=A0A3N5C8I9_9BACI|nr:type II secretion system F family protein [Aquisalibacillus elongatus]RPF55852.1 tight adherence protein C [Aquisalibacillus elongatus]
MGTIIFMLSTFLFVTLVIAGIFHVTLKKDLNIERRIYEHFDNSFSPKDNRGKEQNKKRSQWLTKAIDRLRSMITDRMSLHSIKSLDKKLQEAGRPYQLNAVDFRLLQLALGVGLFVLLFVLFFPITENKAQVFLFCLAAGLIGAVYPMANLNTRIKKRIKEIEKMMPDYFDMLNLSVEAGMGLDSSVMEVSHKLSGPLSEEFLATIEDMNLGKSRLESFADLRDRIPSDHFQSVIRALIQADRLGVGMSKVIRVQTERIRETQLQSAREKSMKAPVKMLIPMVFCIFPLLFIVLMGPVLIQIMTTLFN